jgi:hypothetical protein
MKLYRFSPIKSKDGLLKAIEYTHFSCYRLCKDAVGKYLSNAGNIGIFCHYDSEYEFLTKLRQELTEPGDPFNQKYYRLHKPIVILANDDVPETTYTHLYIRKPDPYRAQVGDVDFYLDPEEFKELKQSMLAGKKIKGARVFDRQDLDMIELCNPDVDTLGYISTHKMTEKVRVKQSKATNL